MGMIRQLAVFTFLLLYLHCILYAQPDYFTFQKNNLQVQAQSIHEKMLGIGTSYPSISFRKQIDLQIGMKNAVIPVIKQQLHFWGDYNTMDESQSFDSLLYKAVCQFQYRNGLKVTGIIDRNCVHLLNVRPEIIQKKIEKNLTRISLIADGRQPQYIVVNIPQGIMMFYCKDSLFMQMKIIAGKTKTPTKSFQTFLEAVVVHPYWNIPKSILEKEIMPQIYRHPDWMQQQHMEWYQGKVRQLPGPWNALGIVKFVIPNNYGIYMHDTPTKHLFGYRKRFFSHGCIRLENAQQLAQIILRNEGWSDVAVAKAYEKVVQKKIQIRSKVLVSVVYMTTTIDQNGRLMIWEDVYKKD